MGKFTEPELKDILLQLEKIKGRHTELVSFYIPAGFNLAKAMELIKQEESTAQNVKSKAVRKNVMASLDKILQHLRAFKSTPENGLVVFCGNISEKEGVSDIEMWSVEPPEPARQKFYWCGQNFILDPLLEMVRERELYGLIVVDKSDATIGLLKGKRIEMLKHLDSIVPGKTKKGGWSQARYARIREGLLEDFLKKVGEIASAQFKGIKDLKGVLIGGPGPVKEQFVEEGFLDYQIKAKVLGVVSTSYTGEYGLEELVNRGEDLISQAAVIREKKILDRLFDELGRDTGMAVYGLPNVLQVLESGNADMLIIAEGFDWIKVKYKCVCGWEGDKLIKSSEKREHYCHKCDNKLRAISENNFLNELENLAKNMGTKIEVISKDTPRCEQLRELGGIGAILRYKIS